MESSQLCQYCALLEQVRALRREGHVSPVSPAQPQHCWGMAPWAAQQHQQQLGGLHAKAAECAAKGNFAQVAVRASAVGCEGAAGGEPEARSP